MRVPVPKWFYDITSFIWVVIFLIGAIALSFAYSGWQQLLAILASLLLGFMFFSMISDNIKTVKEKRIRRNFKRLNEYLMIVDPDESRQYIRSHPQFQNRSSIIALVDFSTKVREMGNIAGELFLHEKIRIIKEFID